MLGPRGCGPGEAPGDGRGTCGVSLGTSARRRLGQGPEIAAAWAEAAGVGCRDRRPGARHRPEGHSLPLGPVVPVREEARGHASARGARPSRSRRGAAGSQAAESRAVESQAARGSDRERLGCSEARAAWDRGSLAGKGGAGRLRAWRRMWPKTGQNPPRQGETYAAAGGCFRTGPAHARLSGRSLQPAEQAGACGVAGAVAMATAG